MRKGSFLTKLRDVIVGPPPPAHLRQHLTMPWYESLWRSIRPPKSTPRQPVAMNRSQGRLVRIAIAVIALLTVSTGIYFYMFSNREGRSMATMQAGLRASAKVDYNESVRLFTKAISIWPANAEAYLQRGNSLASLGDAVQAKRDWEKATQIDPKLADAFTARGTQSRIEGNNQQALTELNRSIELHPSVDAYYQRGQLYATLHEYRKAIEDYDRSIGERRDAPYVYRARSFARRSVGDISGATADRDTADRIEGIRRNAIVKP